MKIQPHGSYYQTDEHGFLRNGASLDLVQPELRGVVQPIVDAYLARYGDAVHGVYLRGSVACGQAVPGLSDLDTMAVMQPGRCPEESDEQWEGETEASVLEAFPGLVGVELFLVPIELVRTPGHSLSFVLATQGLCVHGEDATRGLPGYRIDESLAFNARGLEDDLATYLELYPDEDETGRIMGIAWIAKRFLRVGMELTMQREGRYARALYLCYESFVRHYPERQPQAWRALEMALEPEPGPDALLWVEEHGRWLVAESRARLSGSQG